MKVPPTSPAALAVVDNPGHPHLGLWLTSDSAKPLVIVVRPAWFSDGSSYYAYIPGEVARGLLQLWMLCLKAPGLHLPRSSRMPLSCCSNPVVHVCRKRAGQPRGIPSEWWQLVVVKPAQLIGQHKPNSAGSVPASCNRRKAEAAVSDQDQEAAAGLRPACWRRKG